MFEDEEVGCWREEPGKEPWTQRPERKGGRQLMDPGGCGEDLDSTFEGHVLPRDALSREAWQADTADMPRMDSGGTGHTGSPVRRLNLFTRARWCGFPRVTGHVSCVSPRDGGWGDRAWDPVPVPQLRDPGCVLRLIPPFLGLGSYIYRTENELIPPECKKS